MKKIIYLVTILLGGMLGQGAFAADCVQGEATRIWIAPQTIKPGVPVRVMAVSTAGPITEMLLTDPQGTTTALMATLGLDGIPWWSASTIDPLADNGHYRVEARTNSDSSACRELYLGATDREKPVWDQAHEAFFAAWIEHLFDGPIDQDLSFPSLEPVLRDPERNFLHNSLGMQEDKNLPATPDCADFPYYLRSYFAWKNGLPFSYRFCNRGSATKPPTCDAAVVNTDFVRRQAPASAFRAVSARLMDAVQSGNGRTGLTSQETDFYPVPLRREVLWPGTIFADPYGHVLVLAKWVDQGSDGPGILFAVDAQPDNSIARKRFWEGTFLFAQVAGAGPGFKAFRPLGGNNRLLGNSELPNYSLEQAELTPEEFYARMYGLMNPDGLDAKQAYEAALTALVEQLETRVKSVDNGEAYFRKNGAPIAMPQGAAIFETVGPWEDYSTPSRDMRLIIAMNVLADFPQKVRNYPELFQLATEEAPQAGREIEQLHARLTAERTIRYTRSNGEGWELSVAEVLARKSAFEMGYNPNDCVEIRWGAAPGSEEYASCRRHAPAAQTKQMQAVRDWFREARRPAR
ncbi:hypothetical protein [Desulfobulbus sp.]|uniref:hypothetical protein n=1 Tax=Desulfobulbus sp. TaxID=895 RepID=UPI00286F71CF|nr:hypothetical protein [Desulfobulbus sp.]